MLRRSTWHTARRHVDDVATGDHDVARLGPLLAIEQAQQGALARPRRADHEDELALVDVERRVAEGTDVGAVEFGDVFESDHVGFVTSERSSLSSPPVDLSSPCVGASAGNPP